MISSDRDRRNLRLLLTARGVRAFGDGFVSILVPAYLTGIGFGAFEVGALTTAMLLGPAIMTLVVGLIAHRLKARRLLATATALMVLSGIGYAFETEFWPLLVIALVGTLSPTASDVSVFASLEQTLLSNAAVPRQRTSIFATYSLIGSVLSAVGCLFASAPEIVAQTGLIPPNRALQGMFLVYALLGAIAFMIYRQLKSPAEATVSEPAVGPLGPSRRIVFTLAALFSLDSFGGGLYVQSLLALWLFDHFGLSLTAAGSLFFWSGLLSASSYPIAVRLARRIGLVNTMVFTHLPSNVCLMLTPFAPTLGIAIALLLIRSTLSQMDVPARTSYVMAVVTPPERPAAASVTAAPRSIAGAASPALAGYLLGLSSFGWPLAIGGTLNSLYDLLLLFMFRKVRPPEEQGLEDVDSDVSSTYHVADPSITVLGVSALRAVSRPFTSLTADIGKSLDCRRQIPQEGLERLSVRPQRAPLASQVAQHLPAYLLPPKPFGGLTKCLFPRNTEVLKQQVMVIAFGDLIKHAALARARHPTGSTLDSGPDRGPSRQSRINRTETPPRPKHRVPGLTEIYS